MTTDNKITADEALEALGALRQVDYFTGGTASLYLPYQAARQATIDYINQSASQISDLTSENTRLRSLLAKAQDALEPFEGIYILNVPLKGPDFPESDYARDHIPYTAGKWGDYKAAASLLSELRSVK